MLFLSLNLLILINKCYCISINLLKLIINVIISLIDDIIYYIMQLIVK